MKEILELYKNGKATTEQVLEYIDMLLQKSALEWEAIQLKAVKKKAMERVSEILDDCLTDINWLNME